MKNEGGAELNTSILSEGANKALNPNMLLAKSLTSCLAYPNNLLLAFCKVKTGV